jgi:integrase
MKTHLTKEQVDQLLEALRGHPLEAIITLALVTGMRRDELLRLKWQEIDLEKGEVRVLNTKTKSGSRLNHVPQWVTEMLKQHRMRQMQARLAAGPVWQNLDLVFPDRAGGFLGPDQLLQGLYAILAQAALPPLRFHELRVARWQALREQLRTTKEDRERDKHIDPE